MSDIYAGRRFLALLGKLSQLSGVRIVVVEAPGSTEMGAEWWHVFGPGVLTRALRVPADATIIAVRATGSLRPGEPVPAELMREAWTDIGEPSLSILSYPEGDEYMLTIECTVREIQS